ncbi:uncharacterized protein LOC115881667 [Sitophilus oryzae]|uniref:Uncharacterized protein LOC115881667 n=1 Tax=Sitophilus oryzae TaxID=7048 RepID=A0A6J2XUA2_SITOR|nr:uncharacterized protein LOC115881667 [Sitophilus oryzae]
MRDFVDNPYVDEFSSDLENWDDDEMPIAVRVDLQDVLNLMDDNPYVDMDESVVSLDNILESDDSEYDPEFDVESSDTDLEESDVDEDNFESNGIQDSNTEAEAESSPKLPDELSVSDPE